MAISCATAARRPPTCGNVGNIEPVGFSFGSYNVGGGPPPMLLAKNSVPDVTPDAYRGPTPQSTPSLFSGPGYAGGDRVARWLIDSGVDVWLQQNGDFAQWWWAVFFVDGGSIPGLLSIAVARLISKGAPPKPPPRQE